MHYEVYRSNAPYFSLFFPVSSQTIIHMHTALNGIAPAFYKVISHLF